MAKKKQASEAGEQAPEFIFRPGTKDVMVNNESAKLTNEEISVVSICHFNNGCLYVDLMAALVVLRRRFASKALINRYKRMLGANLIEETNPKSKSKSKRTTPADCDQPT